MYTGGFISRIALVRAILCCSNGSSTLCYIDRPHTFLCFALAKCLKFAKIIYHEKIPVIISSGMYFSPALFCKQTRPLQYTQTGRSVGGCRATYAGIDLNTILATTLRPCRVNGCVYCEHSPLHIRSHTCTLYTHSLHTLFTHQVTHALSLHIRSHTRFTHQVTHTHSLHTLFTHQVTCTLYTSGHTHTLHIRSHTHTLFTHQVTDTCTLYTSGHTHMHSLHIRSHILFTHTLYTHASTHNSGFGRHSVPHRIASLYKSQLRPSFLHGNLNIKSLLFPAPLWIRDCHCVWVWSVRWVMCEGQTLPFTFPGNISLNEKLPLSVTY